MSPSKRSSSPASASSSSDAARGRCGPLGRSNFSVDWGGRGALSQGFVEVVFPRFLADRDAPGAVTEGDGATPGAEHLILRRGATGALDLYDWWDRARRGRAPRRRVVTVALLDAAGRNTVMTWRFSGARPVSLAYSQLLAMDPGVLMETIEIAYDDVELL